MFLSRSPAKAPVPLVRQGLLICCAWCGRYLLTDGKYGHQRGSLPDLTSHTICPDCFDRTLGEHCAQATG